MTFSEKLKKLRREHGLTRKAAAEQSGLNAGTYSAYEDGRRTPTRNSHNYEKLAALFGVTEQYLRDDSLGDDMGFLPEVKTEETQKRRTQKEEGAPQSSHKPKIHVELQYGNMAVDMESLIAKASTFDATITNLYVKPEENMVYYVAGERSGSFSIY